LITIKRNWFVGVIILGHIIVIRRAILRVQLREKRICNKRLLSNKRQRTIPVFEVSSFVCSTANEQPFSPKRINDRNHIRIPTERSEGFRRSDTVSAARPARASRSAALSSSSSSSLQTLQSLWSSSASLQQQQQQQASLAVSMQSSTTVLQLWRRQCSRARADRAARRCRRPMPCAATACASLPPPTTGANAIASTLERNQQTNVACHTYLYRLRLRSFGLQTESNARRQQYTVSNQTQISHVKIIYYCVVPISYRPTPSARTTT
jgi:hypothetical protein